MQQDLGRIVGLSFSTSSDELPSTAIPEEEEDSSTACSLSVFLSRCFTVGALGRPLRCDGTLPSNVDWYAWHQLGVAAFPCVDLDGVL